MARLFSKQLVFGLSWVCTVSYSIKNILLALWCASKDFRILYSSSQPMLSIDKDDRTQIP
ncbi:Putative membrane protein [Amycolatopsis japonica]|uniref:Putative membrane protein n=1 Tax=Amycolatopsis japonica TaxID=208439 RepID=A0A075UMH2_9PSEU|nr:Putative membrane protein [Amycolatopsis japonica]